MSQILWPLVQNIIRKQKLSNTFGEFPGQRNSGVHWGWDFYAAKGTECYAIADGEIQMIYGKSTDTDGFGLVVVLKFNFENRNLYAAYCHLDKAIVSPGVKVKAGDFIGYTGNSGNAHNMKGADEHLHFEIREEPRPPKGKKGRLSPFVVFKKCPLHEMIIEP